jgi:hypothetical protein
MNKYNFNKKINVDINNINNINHPLFVNKLKDLKKMDRSS